MLGLIGRFLRAASGVMSVKFVIWLPVFLVLAGLGIDGASGYAWRMRLQMAADAAALAAATEMPNTVNAEAKAREYIVANLGVDILLDEDVVYGTWDSANEVFTPGGLSPNAVQILARRESARGNGVPTIFLSLLGISDWDVGASAVATATQVVPTELAIAFDASASMGRAGRIADARETVITALAHLDTFIDEQESFHVSLVPIHDRINLGASWDHWVSNPAASNAIGSVGDVCVRPREQAEAGFPHALTDTPASMLPFQVSTKDNELVYARNASSLACGTPIVQPTQVIETVTNTLERLPTHGAGRYDVGLAWAWRMVSPNWAGEWGLTNYPRPMDQARKIVMFVADGVTTINNDFASGGFNEHSQLPLSATTGKMSLAHGDHLVELCAKMQSQGVEVIIIAPNSVDPMMDSAMTRCVAGSSRSQRFTPSNQTELDDALEDLVEDSMPARLVQ